MADKEKKAAPAKVKVKASDNLKSCRHSALPEGFLTREELNDLKAGGTLEIDKNKFDPLYFVEA